MCEGTVKGPFPCRFPIFIDHEVLCNNSTTLHRLSKSVYRKKNPPMLTQKKVQPFNIIQKKDRYDV